MENNIDINKNQRLLDAVDVLTDRNYNPSDVAEVLELAYRNYAYNHIALEDKGVTSADEATRVLNLLGLLLDGVRGKFLDNNRKETKR